MTSTWLFSAPAPSSCTKNSVFSLLLASCSVPPPPLVVSRLSISSRKTKLGASARAQANNAFTFFSPSPTILLVRADAEMLKNVKLHCAATAFASIVFPLPGGPKSSSPLVGLRRPVKSLGFFLGKMTLRNSVFLASCSPWTSSKVTPCSASCLGSRISFLMPARISPGMCFVVSFSFSCFMMGSAGGASSSPFGIFAPLSHGLSYFDSPFLLSAARSTKFRLGAAAPGAALGRCRFAGGRLRAGASRCIGSDLRPAAGLSSAARSSLSSRSDDLLSPELPAASGSSCVVGCRRRSRICCNFDVAGATDAAAGVARTAWATSLACAAPPSSGAFVRALTLRRGTGGRGTGGPVLLRGAVRPEEAPTPTHGARAGSRVERSHHGADGLLRWGSRLHVSAALRPVMSSSTSPSISESAKDASCSDDDESVSSSTRHACLLRDCAAAAACSVAAGVLGGGAVYSAWSTGRPSSMHRATHSTSTTGTPNSRARSTFLGGAAAVARSSSSALGAEALPPDQLKTHTPCEASFAAAAVYSFFVRPANETWCSHEGKGEVRDASASIAQDPAQGRRLLSLGQGAVRWGEEDM
eukprot:Rhum_TRINITY_DN132_c0_g2::Rhum_TRINITY_DN132_c0_g2_i1::g.411::m.411